MPAPYIRQTQQASSPSQATPSFPERKALSHDRPSPPSFLLLVLLLFLFVLLLLGLARLAILFVLALVLRVHRGAGRIRGYLEAAGTSPTYCRRVGVGCPAGAAPVSHLERLEGVARKLRGGLREQ